MRGNRIELFKRLREYIKIIFSIFFSWMYFPHYIVYLISNNKKVIDSDLLCFKTSINIGITMQLFYQLHCNSYYRTLFYYRIGSVASIFISWYRPGDKYFIISQTSKIGAGAYFAHPYSTILNVNYIGNGFSCRQLTTIGNKYDGDNDNRPFIGDNVTLGVNVTIIGNVKIGDNVTIGAGSVVVKDIPNNCIAVGNPCKPIKFLNPISSYV